MSTILMFATVLMAPFFAPKLPNKTFSFNFRRWFIIFCRTRNDNWATYKSASNRLMEIYDNTAEADKQLESLQVAGQQTLEAANKASLKGNFAMGVALLGGLLQLLHLSKEPLVR